MTLRFDKYCFLNKTLEFLNKESLLLVMKSKQKNKLSSFLRDARLKAGLSQGDISNALGYTSAQFISNWERGLSSPPLDRLYEIVQLLKIDSEELIELLLEEQENLIRQQFKKKKAR